MKENIITFKTRLKTNTIFILIFICLSLFTFILNEKLLDEKNIKKENKKLIVEENNKLKNEERIIKNYFKRNKFLNKKFDLKNLTLMSINKNKFKLKYYKRSYKKCDDYYSYELNSVTKEEYEIKIIEKNKHYCILEFIDYPFN